MKLKYLIRLATVATACNSLTIEAVSVEDASCGVSASASLGREKNSGTGQRNNYGLRATASLEKEKNCKCILMICFVPSIVVVSLVLLHYCSY